MYTRLAHSGPTEAAGLTACSTGSRGRTDGSVAQVGRGVVGRALHALQRGLQLAPLAGLRQRLHLAQQRLGSGPGQLQANVAPRAADSVSSRQMWLLPPLRPSAMHRMHARTDMPGAGRRSAGRKWQRTA
jgi:hypothetical protein